MTASGTSITLSSFALYASSAASRAFKLKQTWDSGQRKKKDRHHYASCMYIPGLLFFRRLWEPLWFDSFVKEILWKNKGRHTWYMKLLPQEWILVEASMLPDRYLDTLDSSREVFCFLWVSRVSHQVFRVSKVSPSVPRPFIFTHSRDSHEHQFVPSFLDVRRRPKFRACGSTKKDENSHASRGSSKVSCLQLD